MKIEFKKNILHIYIYALEAITYYTLFIKYLYGLKPEYKHLEIKDREVTALLIHLFKSFPMIDR